MHLSKRRKRILLNVGLYLVTAGILVAGIMAADWDRISHHFFNTEIARSMLPEVLTVAARNTVVYAILSFGIGLVFALSLALMRMSSVLPLRAFAIAYIELFRGLPALVTLILLAFGIPIAFSFRVPGGIIGAAVLGLSIVAGAYMAETIRGGIEAVPKGQTEAARSLGMSQTRTMFTIVLPQAFRIMIPPLTNEMVLLIKDTSLFFVIGSTPATRELVKFARDFMSIHRNATPLTVIAVVYLLITLPLTWLVRRMEKKTARSR